MVNEYRPTVKGGAVAGKVTVGLASHRLCGTSIYGLNGLRKGDEHPAYSTVAVPHLLPFKGLSATVAVRLHRQGQGEEPVITTEAARG